MAKKRPVRMIEWYRADRSARIRRVLVLASTFVATGASVGAAAIRWGHGLAYVALALVYAHAGTTKRMPWKFIDDVVHENGILVVTLRSGKRVEIRERFAGTTRATLVEHIERARMRAQHGLL